MDKKPRYANAPVDPMALANALLGYGQQAALPAMPQMPPQAMPMQAPNAADNEVAAWFRANGGQGPTQQQIQEAAANFFAMPRR